MFWLILLIVVAALCALVLFLIIYAAVCLLLTVRCVEFGRVKGV